MNLYKDRKHAGETLARILELKKVQNPFILALPRGGVPVATIIAEKLHAPLSVLIVRKIGYPGHREYGIGAISEDNEALIANNFPHNDPRLLEIITEEREELRRRKSLYRDGKELPDLKGKTVIIVDDGLATGLTAMAAGKYLRKVGVGHSILAVPVAPPTEDKTLLKFVDEVVCPYRPVNFSAVGSWYEDFMEVSDEEVIDLLEESSRPSPHMTRF